VLQDVDGGNGGLLLAQAATLPQAGMLQSLSFYAVTAAGNLRLGIYDSKGTGGRPRHLLAQTAAFAVQPGWNTHAVLTFTTLPAGTYWLAYAPSSSGLEFPVDQGSGACLWARRSFQGMPSTFPTIIGMNPCHWSFYGSVRP